MRILFVTNSLDVGGIENNLVRLVHHLTMRGHAITVAARPGSLSADVARAGSEAVALRMSLRRPLAVARDIGTLARHIAADRPDVVHVFSAGAAVPVAVARAGNAVLHRATPPVIASIMGLHASPGERQGVVRLRVLLTAIGARRLVVMAPAIDAVVRSLPIRRSRVVHQSVVGVDLPEAEAQSGDRERVRAELGIPPTHRLVCSIGRLEPRKSHELFIRAAGAVARTRSDVVFAIAGDGAEEGRLRHEIERVGAGEAVRLLGHRSDVDALLRASDVYVRPGIVEGFIGITVLEAQALGVPVVSFDTQDVRLAITDGDTGLLVPSGDVDALAAAVCRLLDDPSLSTRIAERARERVERTYSLPAVVTGLEDLYERVLAERGGY